MSLKLHLGCGNVTLPGYRNIDRRYQPGVDEVNNIGLLQHYEPNSIEEIYACHCLDHFDRWTYKTVLKRWFDLLAPGGVLRISTPDFEATVQRYIDTANLGALIGQLYAGQDYEGNCRKWTWDFRLAMLELWNIGFRQIARYDAKAFLDSLDGNPQRDASVYTWGPDPEINGWETGPGFIPRSLNITARKPG